MGDSSDLQESCPLLSTGVCLLLRMHYQQVRDAWYGMRTPDGRWGTASKPENPPVQLQYGSHRQQC